MAWPPSSWVATQVVRIIAFSGGDSRGDAAHGVPIASATAAMSAASAPEVDLRRLPEILAGDVVQVEIELEGGEAVQGGGEVIDGVVRYRAGAVAAFVADLPAEIHELLFGKSDVVLDALAVHQHCRARLR